MDERGEQLWDLWWSWPRAPGSGRPRARPGTRRAISQGDPREESAVALPARVRFGRMFLRVRRRALRRGAAPANSQ